MKKSFIAVLIIGFALLTALPAAAIAPYFNALYWAKGEVTVTTSDPPPSTALELRKVIFFKELPGAMVMTTVEVIDAASGKYMLNIYNEKDLEIKPGESYQVAIANDPNDNYGAWPQTVQITDRGFVEASLNVQWGAGPILPLEGAVPLTIVRDPNNTDLRLYWSLSVSPTTPKFFTLTGDGTGVYANVKDSWNEMTNIPPENINATEGYIVLPGENGAGLAEGYYKAIKPNLDKDSVYPDGSTPTATNNILQSAWAVGKTNLSLRQGQNNLISIPFIQYAANGSKTTDPALIFGNGFQDNNSIRTYYNDYENSGVANAQVWPEWSFNSQTNQWGPADPRGIQTNKGFWFISGSAKTITLLGAVKNDNQNYTISNGQNNLIGIPYPKLAKFTNSGTGGGQDLLGLGNAINADAMIITYDLDDPNGNVWPNNDYNSTAGTWSNGTANLSGFLFCKGFWVKSGNNNDVPWKLAKPY